MKRREFLLGHADIHDAILRLKPLQALPGNVVFALAFFKPYHLNLIVVGKGVDLFHKLPGHRRHQGGGGHSGASMLLEILGYIGCRFAAWIVGIEMQPVNAFEVQDYTLFQQFGHSLRYP
jgi:hypothetical protein